MEESPIKKYIIYALLGIGLAGLIFAVFAFLFLRPKTPEEKKQENNSIIGWFLGSSKPEEKTAPVTAPPPPPPEAEATSTLPALPPKLIQLTDFSVASLALNKSGEGVVFYKKEGGAMFDYDFSGKRKDKISNITIVGIFDIAWNPKTDRRVVSYLDQETIKSFVHIATSAVALLPVNIKNPVWSPEGTQLAYLAPNNTRLNLVFTDNTGKNPKIVYTTPLRDASVQWATSDRIIFETAPSGLVEGAIFSFSRKNGNFDTIMKGFGITSKWSPGGSLALVSQTSNQGKKLKLSIYDTAGNELFDPNLATLSEKCFWFAVKKAYCAVPRNLPANAVIPDEYLRGEINTGDKIVIIDIEKNEIRELFNEKNFDISNLLVTRDEKYAVFIDRADGTVWGIKLK